MSKFLLSTTALMAMGSVAMAADLPARVMAPAPAPVLAPVFTWTGFYAGVNVGGAWNGKSSCPLLNTYGGGVATPVAGYTPNCDSGHNVGFTAGGQIGFNWQMNALVFGVEGDLNWIGSSGRNGYDYHQLGAPVAFAPNVILAYNTPGVPASGVASSTTTTSTAITDNTYRYSGTKNNALLGTARLRLGYAVDRALFFVTGGAAFRGNNNNDTVTQTSQTTTVTTSTTIVTATGAVTNPPPVVATGAPVTTTYTRSSNGSNIGWALGGGIEYALTNNLSMKAEYLHAQFEKGGNLYLPATANGSAFVGNPRNSMDMVRVGLNWRFGGASTAAPVLARY